MAETGLDEVKARGFHMIETGDAIELALTGPIDWQQFESLVAEILRQDDFPRLRKLGGPHDFRIDAVEEAYFGDESRVEAVVQVSSQRTQLDKFTSTVSRLREARVSFEHLVLVFRQPVASATRTKIQREAREMGISVDVRDQSYLVAQLGGRAAHRVGGACFDSLAANLSDQFGQLFPAYFVGILGVWQRLALEHRDRRPEDVAPLLVEPICDLLALSGYAFAWAEFHRNPRLWDRCRVIWERFLAEDAAEKLKMLAAFARYRKSLFAVTARGVLRTGWKMRFEGEVAGLSKRNRVRGGGGLHYREVVGHPSALVRVLGGSRWGSPYDGIDIMTSLFLAGQLGAEGLDFGSFDVAAAVDLEAAAAAEDWSLDRPVRAWHEEITRAATAWMFVDDVYVQTAAFCCERSAKIRVTSSPADERTAREICGILWRFGRGRELPIPEVVLRFVENACHQIAYDGEVWFELVRRPESSDGPPFVLLPIAGPNVISLPGLALQYTPGGHEGPEGRRAVWLAKRDLWHLKLPRKLGTPRQHRRLLRLLMRQSSVAPNFVLEDVQARRAQTGFDFKQFERVVNGELAKATRRWGWRGRGLWREDVLEHYEACLHLRFRRAITLLVAHVVDQFNRLLERENVAARIAVEGLPTADDFERVQGQVEEGAIGFAEAIEALKLD